MPPARGHRRHHCHHNLILANERRCPSSRRKPRRLPRPWRVFWRKEHCWDHPPLTAPPPRRRRRRSPRGRRGEEAGEAIFVKAIDLPRAGHHCLPGGRESRAATIRVHPLPCCPTPPSRLVAATPTMCRGEGSPLAMKQSIRTASASSCGGVHRHILLYNSADRPTHQFCSLRD